MWPETVAPFSIHIIQVGEDEKVREHAKEIYDALKSSGVEVLFDDRDLRPGAKFADADLIGIPQRAVVSQKTMEIGKIEVTDRGSSKTTMVEQTEFLKP